MADSIILLFVLVIIIFAVKGSIKHFKGEGGCCGGGSKGLIKAERKNSYIRRWEKRPSRSTGCTVSIVPIELPEPLIKSTGQRQRSITKRGRLLYLMTGKSPIKRSGMPLKRRDIR